MEREAGMMPNLRELVACTIRHREGMGFQYPAGTLEDAILAAENVSTREAMIMAIQNVLQSREERAK